MVYFFYGEDTFRLKESVLKTKRSFVEKQGSDINLLEMDGEKLTFSSFGSAVNALPFLGDKRLIIVNNLLLENDDKELKKKVVENLAQIPDSSVVIFVEAGMPDKRETAFKKLSIIDSKHYFGLLDDYKLKAWVENKVAEMERKIDLSAVQKLILFVGPDLWRMSQEIEKLTLNSTKEVNISVVDVEKLVEPTFSLKIFDLIDALSQKQGSKAVSILHQFIENGQDEFMIFNMMIWGYRNMVVVDSLGKVGSESEMANLSGLNPFVVKKNLQALRNYQKGEAKEIYKKLAETDWQIKSGKIDIKTALSLLVVEFSKR
jgi:DNA polymerase-3 subunit delta